MTQAWEAEIQRLLAKVAELSFTVNDLRTANERLQTGWELATKAVDENTSLRAEVERAWEERDTYMRSNVKLVAEVERLREIGEATFMAMCAFRDNNDEEAFQDAIDALGAALVERKP